MGVLIINPAHGRFDSLYEIFLKESRTFFLFTIQSPLSVHYFIDMEHLLPLIRPALKETGPPTNLIVAPIGTGIKKAGKYLLRIDLYFVTVLGMPATTILCGHAKMINLPDPVMAQF